MTTGIEEPSSRPTPVAAKKSVFARIAGVLFSPTETFEDIVRKPDVLAPMLILLVIGYAVTFVIMPIMDWDSIIAQQTEQMHKSNPNMTDADIERATNMIKTFGRVMGFIGPLFGAILWIIIAGALFLAFRMFGGEGTFKQAVSVTIYSWVPLTLSSILLAIVAFSQHAFDPTRAATIVKSNPAFLVDMKDHPVLFSLLSSFDVFTIATIALLVIGFSILSRFSRAKAAMTIVTLWLVTVAVKVGFAAMGAARMKG
jgi:hypothetical protein